MARGKWAGGQVRGKWAGVGALGAQQLGKRAAVGALGAQQLRRSAQPPCQKVSSPCSRQAVQAASQRTRVALQELLEQCKQRVSKLQGSSG